MKHLLSILSIALLFSCSGSKTATCNYKQETLMPIAHSCASNTTYWQQHVDYKMDIDINVNTYQYKGKQTLVYTNNSPDVLNKVFYHLYFNAFKPGSEMDVRSRTIADPDPRVGNRISQLKPNEIGYINVSSLKQNGVHVNYQTVGTILEVKLAQPIQPGEKVTFAMLFDAQVPEQIRRSGRNNTDGVSLSMSQWYPKMAEYDFEGWHADPYIGREFHGVWGDFDVKITINKNYIIGGTGYLQNPNEIGYGYETETITRPNSNTLTWHFKAPNVHDFTWAADPDFLHDTLQVPNGPLLHFLYSNDDNIIANWKKMQPEMVKIMQYYSEHIGPYPYEQYSFIQGGDGGMEYGMCTLITGGANYGGLLGTAVHELAHSWFQFVLATNEAKHAWMDEGFTTYISTLAGNAIKENKATHPLNMYYDNYIGLAKSGVEQPLTTHADRYELNAVYGAASYVKGAVFLAQLGYIIGENNLEKTIKKYYSDFAFKHPKPLDIIRTAEKISGLELDWYLTDFGQTTNTIDYAVKTVEEKSITLERIALMPMPIDLTITYTDGSTQDFYIPLQMMRGEKPTVANVLKDWAWAYPTYTFETSKKIKSVQIDPKNRMADIDKTNNAK